MLSEQEIARFHQDGYLRGRRVLSDEQVERLQEEMARVVREHDRKDQPQPVLCHNLNRDDSRPVWQIVNIWQASAPFRELVQSPQIAAEIAKLTGASELRIWHDQIQYKPAGTGGVNMWHQDAPLWPILQPMTEVSAWVALDDVDEDNGCMSMVPGSHTWGNHMDFLRTLKGFDEMPAEFQGRKVEVRRCPVRRGEVHFHHALTWHGSHANTSARPRRAIAIHYMSDETRFVASGQHVMKPFVEVADGEVMRGTTFPLVWQRNGSEYR
jgi:phytanoyl-CoA hydroxylase